MILLMSSVTSFPFEDPWYLTFEPFCEAPCNLGFEMFSLNKDHYLSCPEESEGNVNQA